MIVLTNALSELPPDVADKYSTIIDNILENADLNTISAKRIRKGLQERLGHDISGEKVNMLAKKTRCCRTSTDPQA